MALSRKEIDALLEVVSVTCTEEISCDGCLKELAEFAELSLHGKTIPQGLRLVQAHLALCGECREEFAALLRALEGEDTAK